MVILMLDIDQQEIFPFHKHEFVHQLFVILNNIEQHRHLDCIHELSLDSLLLFLKIQIMSIVSSSSVYENHRSTQDKNSSNEKKRTENWSHLSCRMKKNEWISIDQLRISADGWSDHHSIENEKRIDKIKKTKFYSIEGIEWYSVKFFSFSTK